MSFSATLGIQVVSRNEVSVSIRLSMAQRLKFSNSDIRKL